MLDAQMKMVSSPWFRYFLTYDPRPTLSKVQVPVLAITAWGEPLEKRTPPWAVRTGCAPARETGASSSTQDLHPA